MLLSIFTACGDATARAEIESVSRVWEASLLAGQPSKAVSEVFTKDALRLPAVKKRSEGNLPLLKRWLDLLGLLRRGS